MMTMKKILFLTVCVLLAFMMGLSLAEGLPETRSSSPWVYSLLPDGTAAITGYKGDAVALAVPPSLDDIPVSAISYKALRRVGGLVNVILPEGVTVIEDHVFDDNFSLENIALPKTMTLHRYKAQNGTIVNYYLYIPEAEDPAEKLPILIYFLANGALNSLWEAYFYNNIFLYHSGEADSALASVPVIRNIYIPLYAIFKMSVKYPKFGILLLATFVSLFFIGKEYRKKTLLLFLTTFILSVGITFTRNTFIYYYIYILAGFFALALIPFCKGMALIKKFFKQNPAFMQGLITGALVVFYALILLLNKNTYLIFQKKEFLAQFRYAETINQTPDARILTYDVMDSGFYTAAGLLPQNRFFCFLNIESGYPAILEEQNRLIEAGYFDYIVTSFSCECDWDNYVLVREETDTYIDYTGEKALDGYRLYKRI